MCIVLIAKLYDNSPILKLTHLCIFLSAFLSATLCLSSPAPCGESSSVSRCNGIFPFPSLREVFIFFGVLSFSFYGWVAWYWGLAEVWPRLERRSPPISWETLLFYALYANGSADYMGPHAFDPTGWMNWCLTIY